MAKRYRRLYEREILILDGPVHQGTESDNLTMIDVIPAAMDVSSEAEGKVFAGEALSLLTSQEQEVVKATILNGLTQRETARKLGVSQPVIYRVKKRALNKLRNNSVLGEPTSK